MLHWVPQSISLRKIEAILLDEYGIQVSYVKVSQLLTDMGYSKQENQKMLQVGEPCLDHDEQFGIINNLAKRYLEADDPVISVDTKELSRNNFSDLLRKMPYMQAFPEAGVQSYFYTVPKKKENIGNFKNNGAEYRKTKNPRKVWDQEW